MGKKSRNRQASANIKKTGSARNKKKKTRPAGLQLWQVLAAAALVVIALGAVWILRPKAGPSNGAVKKEISISEAFDKYNQGVFLLDVRNQDEWEEYHAPNTTLIPLGQLEKRLNELPKDQEIVVVCRSGNRSKTGRDILLKAGFSNVFSMEGGLNKWRAAGYPTVSGP